MPMVLARSATALWMNAKIFNIKDKINYSLKNAPLHMGNNIFDSLCILL